MEMLGWGNFPVLLSGHSFDLLMAVTVCKPGGGILGRTDRLTLLYVVVTTQKKNAATFGLQVRRL